jgi:diadenosine tetraphosphate (Ap4A) HIT family hydrolase
MKTDSDCIFCKIVLGQSPCFRLLEDEDTLAIWTFFRLVGALSRSHQRALPHPLRHHRRGIRRGFAFG